MTYTILNLRAKRGWRNGDRDYWMAKANAVKITVCSHCHRASCWQGEFYCDQAKTAGTEQITFGRALELNLEDPSWLLRDENMRRVILHGSEL